MISLPSTRAVVIAGGLVLLALSSYANASASDFSSAIKRQPLMTAATPAPMVPGAADNTSVRNEIQHAIDRGLGWLMASQNSNGWWYTEDHPAVTALVLTA